MTDDAVRHMTPEERAHRALRFSDEQLARGGETREGRIADEIRSALAEELTEVWLRELHDGLCSLCGNSGLVDTRSTAISPTGQRVGRVHACVCPNGRSLLRDPQRHAR
jgi:hypothetical protein